MIKTLFQLAFLVAVGVALQLGIDALATMRRPRAAEVRIVGNNGATGPLN